MSLGSQWQLTGRVSSWRSLARGSSRVDALDLGLDATTVWSATDRWKDWANSVDEALLHWAGSVVDGGLDDVIGVAVAEETLKLGLRGEHLIDKHVAALVLSAAEALLDDVGRELLAGELADLPLEHVDEWLREDGLVEVEDILHDVVAEWVLDKNESAVGDLADQPSLLLAGGVVDAALKNAAAVAVGTDIDAVDSDGIKDELGVLGRELVQALLDNVVAVEILDELNHLVAESLDNDRHLLLGRDELNHLLQGSCSMLVQRNADEVMGGVQDKYGAILIVAELEKLLAQVVAERIGHQLDNMWVGLLPDEVDMLLVAALKLLLEETASVLILAQSVDLATEGLECDVGEAVHG